MNHFASMTTTQDRAVKVEAFITSENAKNAVAVIQTQLANGGVSDMHAGTLATAARLVGMAQLGDIVIAELGGEDHATALEMVRDLAADGVRVILLGQQDKVEIYKQFVAAGARDYLALPLGDGFELTADISANATISAPTVANSRTIGICGVSGGVGASVLATNLAVAYLGAARSRGMARDSEGQVALIDADLRFGLLAVDLDTDATAGLLEALLAPQRVDRTFMNATMTTPLKGLSLYSAELSDLERLPAYEAGIPDLLKKISEEYPTVIVDFPRNLIAQNPAWLKGLDEMVFVLGPGFGSVRTCSRLLHLIGEQEDGPRLSFVLSQTRRDAGLRKAEIAKALGRDVDIVLPQAASEMARASVKGEPLQKLSPRSAYARSVGDLLTRLENQKQLRSASKSIWRRKAFV
ncbi:hypothetical protein O4H61_03825 [Roseovarius aestuarii]|nr:hypothetical protein [Roseovarius aestuarii]